MSTMNFLVFFSGIAISSGVITASYFLFVRNENQFKLNILGLLFLAISLRIIKSIIYFSTEIPDIGVAIGYLGLASIGPLLFLYFKFLDSDIKKTNFKKLDYLHFLPAVIGTILISFYGGLVARYFYLITTYVLIIYCSLSWSKYLKSENEFQPLRFWNILVLLFVSAINSIFLFQHYTDTILNYAYGALIASVIVFVLFIFALKNPILFPKRKPGMKNIEPDVIKVVRNSLEVDKLYLQPSLTLDEISKTIDVPSYLISRIVKRTYGRTFPETINYFRITCAADQLIDKNSDYTKIEGLAYNVGFNTPSAFYSAFKKIMGMNPTEFQQKSLKEQQQAVNTSSLSFNIEEAITR